MLRFTGGPRSGPVRYNRLLANMPLRECNRRDVLYECRDPFDSRAVLPRVAAAIAEIQSVSQRIFFVLIQDSELLRGQEGRRVLDMRKIIEAFQRSRLRVVFLDCGSNCRRPLGDHFRLNLPNRRHPHENRARS